ncbi:CDP-glucose 4,6-dehydratase [Pinibacter aurantiacus]|uniref:CDP-glucose 4,6-dehydratase n=1 Tax=Pinibacter aurantiacus TaxID=2851599 RepID=A0A9E2SFP2_9BACT|nr:CDP-glucose 4,6-dehydratase [Pinibacter aurantiacus]MBV4359455.1 CDP-glucose 4,6-dehydratase [Pinibacter aurantiacus]
MESLVTMNRLENSYRGKKVFVTGHTGFKGSWFVSVLRILGANVKGYALEPEYADSLYAHLAEQNLIEQSVIADIRDKQKLNAEIESFQPDFVFHLAAQPLVRRSYKVPAETFEVNVVGTANVLEAVNALQKKCTVVVVTTDKVYENKENGTLYKESDVLGGYDPYSASKACTELVVNSFRSSFFNVQKYASHKKALASARAGNVIGGGDWSQDRIVPDIVRSLIAELAIDVRNPHAVRPWQHVLEPLCGYLILGALLDAEPAKYSGAYNFGPQPKDHLSVKELVEVSIKAWGAGSWNDISDKNQPHEAGLLQLDITKAITELEWQPKLDAAQAIEWTLNWYKQTNADKLDFTFEQIKKYLGL